MLTIKRHATAVCHWVSVRLGRIPEHSIQLLQARQTVPERK